MLLSLRRLQAVTATVEMEGAAARAAAAARAKASGDNKLWPREECQDMVARELSAESGGLSNVEPEVPVKMMVPTVHPAVSNDATE